MKKKLLLFASALMLLPTMMFAASKTAEVKVTVDESVYDWAIEQAGVYFYVEGEAEPIEAVAQTYEVSGDTVWYVAEMPTKSTFFVGNGKDTDFSQVPSRRSEAITLGSARAYIMKLGDKSQSDLTKWYTTLTETADPNPAIESAAKLEYTPGWEKLAITLVKKENNGAMISTTDNFAEVNSKPGASQDWDSQFFIVLPETVPNGTKMRVFFEYKASIAATADTQCHADAGNYLHWSAIGSPAFTTEWKTFDQMFTVPNECNGNFKSIAFNLSKDRGNEVDYMFKRVYVMYEAPKTVEAAGWENVDFQIVKTENASGKQEVVETESFEVNAAAGAATDWDSQVFFVFPETLPVGTKVRVFFDYKSSVAASADTQWHAEPGNYKHWMAIGSPSFKTDWQTYVWEGTVPNETAGVGKSIAFNLSKDKSQDVDFYFKNVCMQIPTKLTEEEDGWDILDFKLAKKENNGDIEYQFAKERVTINAAAGAATDWDSQFWIVLPEPVAPGTELKISFNYRTDSEYVPDANGILIPSQCHALPGDYKHWDFFGNRGFINDWKEYNKTVTVPSQATDQFQSIAFNMSIDKANEANYFLKNICVKVVGEAPYDDEPEVEGNLIDIDGYNFNQGSTSMWASYGVNEVAPEITEPGALNSQYAMKVVTDKAGKLYDTEIAYPMAYNGGYVYNYSFMVKADAPATMSVTTEFIDIYGEWAGENVSGNIDVTTDWKTVSGTFVPEFVNSLEGAAYLAGAFVFNIGDVETNYYFDHIIVTREWIYDEEETVEDNIFSGDDYNFNGETVGDWKVMGDETIGVLDILEGGENQYLAYANSKAALEFEAKPSIGEWTPYSSQIYNTYDFKEGYIYSYDFQIRTLDGSLGEVYVSFQPETFWNGDMGNSYSFEGDGFCNVKGSTKITKEGISRFVLGMGTKPNTYVIDHVIVTETPGQSIIMGINDIETESDGAIYDMLGRKVETMSNGSIYFQNGKKVLK